MPITPQPQLQSMQWVQSVQRPPHGIDTTDAARWIQVSPIVAASSAEIDLFNFVGGLDANAGVKACVFMATVDCCIRFGATGLSAAVATDFPMVAFTLYPWTLLKEVDQFCRVIRKSADGILYFQDTSTLL